MGKGKGKGKGKEQVKGSFPTDEELRLILEGIAQKTLSSYSTSNTTSVPNMAKVVTKKSNVARFKTGVVSKENDTGQLTYTATINCCYDSIISPNNREAGFRNIKKQFCTELKKKYRIDSSTIEFKANNDSAIERTHKNRIEQFARELYSEETKQQQCVVQLCKNARQETHGDEMDSTSLNQNIREYVLQIVGEVLGYTPTISQPDDKFRTIAYQLASLTEQCISSKHNKLIDDMRGANKILKALQVDTHKLIGCQPATKEILDKFKSLPDTVFNLLQVLSLEQLSEDLINTSGELASEIVLVRRIIQGWDSRVMTIIQTINNFFNKHEKRNIFGSQFEATNASICTLWSKEKVRMLGELNALASTCQQIVSLWAQPMHPMLSETYDRISRQLNLKDLEAKKASKQAKAKAKAKAEEHRRITDASIPAKTSPITFFDNRDASGTTAESKQAALIKIQAEEKRHLAHLQRHGNEAVPDDSVPLAPLRPSYCLSTDDGKITLKMEGEDKNIFQMLGIESLWVTSGSLDLTQSEIEPFKENLQRGRVLSRGSKGTPGIKIALGGEWISVKNVGHSSDSRLIAVALPTPDKKIIFIPMEIVKHRSQDEFYKKNPDYMRRIINFVAAHTVTFHSEEMDFSPSLRSASN